MPFHRQTASAGRGGRVALIALSAAMLASAPAAAISRYTSTQLSCGEARERIAREGEVVLRWRSQRDPSLPLYDRFVANRSYCQPTEGLAWSYIPTADDRSCAVTTCKEIIYDDDF